MKVRVCSFSWPQSGVWHTHLMEQRVEAVDKTKWYYCAMRQFEYRNETWTLQDDFGVVKDWSDEYEQIQEAFDKAHPTPPMSRAEMLTQRVIIGWLSPEGKVYYVGSHGHTGAAYDLVFEHGLKTWEERNYGRNEATLYNAGWLGLYYSMITRNHAVPMTEAQKEVLDFLQTLNDNLRIDITEV